MKVVNPTEYYQQRRTPSMQVAPTHYRLRHHTRFRYSAPITESYMEVRMQPMSDGNQVCHSFELTVEPPSRIMSYRDPLGDLVHHFNVPGQHAQLTIKTEAVVECRPATPLPPALTTRAWVSVDAFRQNGQYWDFLAPSQFANPTAGLLALAQEIGVNRRMDPLTLLRWANTAVYEMFDYAPDSTKVDSPIDEALAARRGVCQDFTHILIALVRQVGIPCRYVSGYLFHRDKEDRSLEDASHAWVEALLPDVGWVGFDPTNNLIADDRHIRVALGRDYADVPPTRGVFRGEAETELDVGVQVARTDEPLPSQTRLLPQVDWHPPAADGYQQQQQQQQ